MQRGIVAAVCALVIAVYAHTAQSGYFVLSKPDPACEYYNLLVQGFRAGQLSLKKEVPPGLAQLTDPYDPSAHAPYHDVGDMSYYKGKLYIYFGVTPAVVLFWPYVALTGHYLSQKDAVVIFCLVGFLVSVGLLWALWRRYFAEVNVAVVAAGVLALGLATLVPLLLLRCGIWEVPISCGYALRMLAFGAIWGALHKTEERCWWLVAASVAYGLAVGARPSLLFGAVIVLVPVAQARRERRTVLAPLMAATIPMMLIGLGLMLYNALRFDSPFEFGGHYQLAAGWLLTRRFFSLRYLWFNFRVYFLEPARWSVCFPFVHKIAVPPLPAGYAWVETPFGILTNIPLVWLAAAVPLAWRGRLGSEASTLRWFAAAVAWLFVACALPLGFFMSAIVRYEVDFAPALVLLAVVGLLGLERALIRQPVWRRAARWGWGALLSFSVVFTLFASIGQYAGVQNNLGVALEQAGRVPEAIGHYEQALRLNPDYAEAHYNLGLALERAGRRQEAISHWEQALRLKPDYAEAHNNLGVALEQYGRLAEAIGHYEQALRINPDYAEAHYNLGLALGQTDRMPEAIGHYEQAVRIKPDFAEAHYNLGVALEKAGRVPEAIQHYKQALRIKPDFTQAQNALARLQAGQ